MIHPFPGEGMSRRVLKWPLSVTAGLFPYDVKWAHKGRCVSNSSTESVASDSSQNWSHCIVLLLRWIPRRKAWQWVFWAMRCGSVGGARAHPGSGREPNGSAAPRWRSSGIRSDPCVRRNAQFHLEPVFLYDLPRKKSSMAFRGILLN